jgi:uncharacterized protein (TIGR04255 family)
LDLLGREHGLRFECKRQREISRIYGKRLSSSVKSMLSIDNQTRVIAMEEYNVNDDILLRLQYGVPNKFYPSKISTYDLLLDIDAYTVASTNVESWEETIRTLNHTAYDTFKSAVNEQFLEQLK